jgi:hypothetical protein
MYYFISTDCECFFRDFISLVTAYFVTPDAAH